MATRKPPGRARKPRPLTLAQQMLAADILFDYLPRLTEHRATWAEAAFLVGVKGDMEVSVPELRKVALACGADWPRGPAPRPSPTQGLGTLDAADTLAIVEAIGDLYTCAGEPMPAAFGALLGRAIGRACDTGTWIQPTPTPTPTPTPDPTPQILEDGIDPSMDLPD